jgi:hypothetical protein
MDIIIKYHEKTSGENQMFLLDLTKHYQIVPINTPQSKVDLSKYDGRMVYGTFEGYGRNDGHSIFILDKVQIDRDLKINDILKIDE